MKIYTKTGDSGQTGLFGGPRVDKHHPRIEAYGTIDELNAVLGVARCQALPEEMEAIVLQVQHELFAVGAELATPDPASHGTRLITQSHVESLQQSIDQFEQQLPPLKQFILPAGTPAAASLHVARAVCRRAERNLVALISSSQEEISLALLRYVNRLGDLLFVLARAANFAAGRPDQPWQQS